MVDQNWRAVEKQLSNLLDKGSTALVANQESACIL